MLVGAVVFEHEVQLDTRVAGVDLLYEAQELLVAMAHVAAPGSGTHALRAYGASVAFHSMS